MVPNGYQNVSFNVKSLFTKIPIDQTIDIILRRIYDKHELQTSITRLEMAELLILSADNTEFNLDIGSHVSITLWWEICSWEVWWECCNTLLQAPTATPPPILLYITSRFGYIKHLFCWQFIIMSLHLTSSWILFLRTLAAAFPTSAIWKLFVLVEFENSVEMHVHSTSFPVLLS